MSTTREKGSLNSLGNKGMAKPAPAAPWKVSDVQVAPCVADILVSPGKQQGPWHAPRALSETLETYRINQAQQRGNQAAARSGGAFRP